MSVLNQIQGGRWDTLLRRLYPIKEKSVAPVMGSELLPMVVVQEFNSTLYALREERLYAFTDVLGPTAAQFNGILIDNPVGSGQLFEIIRFGGGRATGARNWGSFITPLGTIPVVAVGDPVGVDSRFAATRPVARLGVVSSVGLASVTFRTGIFQSDAGLIQWYEHPHVISPGFTFILQNQTANENSAFSMVWREIPAEASELNIG